MNLLSIASGAINAANPARPIVWRSSLGDTVSSGNFKPVPSYAAPVTLSGQVQALQYKDLQQLDALNLQGTRRKVYLYGVKDGVVRSLSKGGDLLTDEDDNVWLVAQVLEQWPDWCSVAVTLQND